MSISAGIDSSSEFHEYAEWLREACRFGEFVKFGC